MDEELEALASRLEESGNYRVLRRLTERDLFCADDGNQKRVAVILDVETWVWLDRRSDRPQLPDG